MRNENLNFVWLSVVAGLGFGLSCVQPTKSFRLWQAMDIALTPEMGELGLPGNHGGMGVKA